MAHISYNYPCRTEGDIVAEHTYQKYTPVHKPKHRLRRALLRLFGTILILVLLAAAAGAAFLTITEYKPAATEKLIASGGAGRTMTAGEEFTILSWNLGYGALDEKADFFMDGGKMVLTASEEQVKQNMLEINAEIAHIQPDIILLQEVDRDSKRSSYLDQAAIVHDENPHMASYYATNYRSAFVPLGIPPYGKVESGIQTLTSFKADSATRIALPNSFKWPLSPCQLKRCELMLRIPVEGSDHELVLINEHPDAYTNDERRDAQVDKIRDLLEEEAAKGNWVIAGGDWNHNFSNVDITNYPVLEGSKWAPGNIDITTFGPEWQFLMDNRVPTSRLLDHPMINKDGSKNTEPLQLYMIDGFVMTPNVKLISLETRDLNFKLSDHNPVVIKVLLEKD